MGNARLCRTGQRCRRAVGWLACAPLLCGLGQGVRADDTDFARMLQLSLRDRAGVTLAERLHQDALQQLCSDPAGPPAVDRLTSLQRAQAQQVRLPADGRYLGNWQAGEAIAQNGRGLQFTDPVGREHGQRGNGGNCYACHQLSATEPAYGTLGPSLLGYGRTHPPTPDTLRLTWQHLFNPHSQHLCSTMPRFGAQGILDEQQLRDVMALLFDPASPVNQVPDPMPVAP